mmetsp:Transcript_34086/g.32518  ORF Transcript_34086/g.32518 Transcript_34086/m.32518 type:complete len:341 (-) Transcript_34086:226-1248(-)
MHDFSRLLSSHSDNSVWVSNSKQFNPALTPPAFYTFIYLVIAFSGAILIHSAIIHAKVFKAVRLAVDTSAFVAILLGILILFAHDRPNLTKTAILRDLFAFGFFQAIIQYCDAYMFFKSYAVVVKVAAWKRKVIFTYIWLVLILTYFFKWNLIPFFSSTTNPIYVDAFFVLDQISYYGVILYNFVFTFGFVLELVRISKSTPTTTTHNKSRNRTILLIVSAIGHCVTSSFANLYRTLAVTDLATFPEWVFILVLGLHLWFNMKIERGYGYVIACWEKHVTSIKLVIPSDFASTNKSKSKHASLVIPSSMPLPSTSKKEPLVAASPHPVSIAASFIPANVA